MALKFLNKKGWHTGSLRNIENVWKAEQKHEAEQKKLEELRKQILEERERSEFRLLQEQAGLVPKQERLDFLYESGLAVGKAGASEGFKALEAPKKDDAPSASAASASKQASSSVPGALFEETTSSNDAWRKLHSDPLLMIRQREQEALARIKNNPIQMAMIRKSVEEKKHKGKSHDKKEHRKKHHHSSSKHEKHSSSISADVERRKTDHRKGSKYDKYSDSEDELHKKMNRSERNSYRTSRYREQSPGGHSDQENVKIGNQGAVKRDHDKLEQQNYSVESQRESHHKRRYVAPKLTEEERAARLREMQADAELHEEQRWKRLKKAEEDDAREATRAGSSGGKNFLDAAKKSVYGAEKGGSSTIEESVRRRAYYSQGRSEAGERNAFRR
ncbi:hypothetical protein FNV43_RR08027 [Rhamnella rubrinervis]|uniref:CBF1-interacting co-repressor CIR N-terminal domain-containing protein n=1 Tax=Rhamnella rubrinervis TaxID=2594499 RepID=A0A8K0HGC8_9ROSA|nr:hypothetical protein FNV43_RR08027 [Rhamnella rubrinervis]